jgi:uncharacterized protein
MPFLKRMLSSLIFILVAVWLSLAILIYLFQAHFVYFPSHEQLFSPKEMGMEFEDVYLTTRDKLSIHGWYIPRPGASHTLLFLHGNAGNISHRLDSLKIFHDLGLSILIIDYRGYGQSEGSPNEAGTYLDAQAAWDYLIKERQLAEQDIIIFGRSLGGGIASWLALEQGPAALILESTFTSVENMGSRMYPFLPIKWMSRIHYPSIERVDKIRCPILFIHSPDDEMIPYEFGQQLFQRAESPKTFLSISGGHNEGFLLSGALYTRGIGNFIQKSTSATKSQQNQ